MNLTRILDLTTLLTKKSFFLFGPRATGKSTLIRQQLADKYLVINLLRNEYYMELSQSPQSLEAMINSAKDQTIVIIDEIQRVPMLLNEIHRLIEERQIHFLLTGSSARSLKRKHTNLLAGRARKAELFPLVSAEIPEFNLNHYLHVGGLPMVYLSDEPYEELSAYVNTYMKDEIQAEALVRNIPGFSNFLKMCALTNGKMLNFSSIASDCALPVSTVREYYYILEDTFLGFMLPAFTATQKRKAISTAKFYFFDLGVAHYLAGIRQIPIHTEVYGNALEHFIGLEIRAYLSYQRIDKPLSYWRSTSQMEVDFVIGDEVAIEVKATGRIHDKHFKGLLAFKEEGIANRYILISLDSIHKVYGNGIEALPVEMFLNQLWQGDIICS